MNSDVSPGIGIGASASVATTENQDSSGVSVFLNAASELSENLSRLHMMARQAVDRVRLNRGQNSGFAGLAILDEEIDRFLNAPPPESSCPTRAVDSDTSNTHALEEALEKHRMYCKMRAAAGMRLGVDLRLEQLRERFRLSGLEIDICLICLAPEIDPAYGRLYAYLHNDITRSRPTMSLVLDLLAFDWETRLRIRQSLAGDSVLANLGLIIANADRDNPLENELTLDPSIARFLLGSPITQILESGVSGYGNVDALIVSTAERKSLGSLQDLLLAKPPEEAPLVVVLRGPEGVGKTATAATLTNAAKQQAFLSTLNAADANSLTELRAWLRKVRVLGGTPVLDASREPLATHDRWIAEFIRLIKVYRFANGFLLTDVNAAFAGHNIDEDVRLFTVDLHNPSLAMRKAAWTRFLRDHRLDCDDAEVARASTVFPLTAGKICRAVRQAVVGCDNGKPGPRHSLELSPACRTQIKHRLREIAEPLLATRSWKDLVLPRDEMKRLQEIAGAVRNRGRVMEDWEFRSKVSSGLGVNALFFGPSGTGKTLAASVLAHDLGMEIYRVDLSRVVSKYIGETEKNLDTVFEEARAACAIIFFDEAEALFGKRSEVKDSHDRYSNIEVAYLLQRIENFEGVAILATNLRKNMDNAFVRRLQFAVEFPLPDFLQRSQIWRQVWPAAAELSADVDLEFMARNFELAGGHIRNVAVTAAYLAAQEDEAISMRHLILATRREFQKFGRLVIESEFGGYKHYLPQELVA